MYRWRVRLLVVAGVLIAVVTALTYRLFVWPTTDPPRGRVDAVVVFAGADGERQQEGIGLVQAGVAPVLVISDGGRPDSTNYRVCRERPGISVICFSPDPPTTRAEAEAFATLADDEGWRSLALVTSTKHVRRASLLLDRCYGGKLFTVATPLHNDRRYETPLQILREWPALLVALTIERGC